MRALCALSIPIHQKSEDVRNSFDGKPNVGCAVCCVCGPPLKNGTQGLPLYIKTTQMKHVERAGRILKKAGQPESI